MSLDLIFTRWKKMINHIWICANCARTYGNEFDAMDCFDSCAERPDKTSDYWQCHCGQSHFTELDAIEHCEEIEKPPTAEELEQNGQQRLID